MWPAVFFICAFYLLDFKIKPYGILHLGVNYAKGHIFQASEMRYGIVEMLEGQYILVKTKSVHQLLFDHPMKTDHETDLIFVITNKISLRAFQFHFSSFPRELSASKTSSFVAHSPFLHGINHRPLSSWFRISNSFARTGHKTEGETKGWRPRKSLDPQSWMYCTCGFSGRVWHPGRARLHWGSSFSNQDSKAKGLNWGRSRGRRGWNYKISCRSRM